MPSTKGPSRRGFLKDSCVLAMVLLPMVHSAGVQPAAAVELVQWLVDDYGFEKWEAFQVLSQTGTMRVGNVVDPNYTVVVKFPKRYLPD